VSRRLTDRIAPWLDAAIERLTPDDDAVWDVTLTNADQGPIIVLLVWMKGAVLGTVVHAAAMFGNPYGLTEDDVDRVLPQLIEALHEQRSSQLAEASPNGSAPTREVELQGFDTDER
jgi:hypothetical protein